MSDDSFLFTPHLEALTCVCGKPFQIGETDGDPRSPGQPMPTILHALPTCDAYETLDLPEFLEHVRKSKEQ